jgi:hypothetical protein
VYNVHAQRDKVDWADGFGGRETTQGWREQSRSVIRGPQSMPPRETAHILTATRAAAT